MRRAPGEGRPDGPGAFGGRGGEAPGFGDRFKRFDANGDGKLALEELPEPLRERFGPADANKDGVIDDEEGKAAFQRPAGDRPGRGERPFGDPPSARRPGWDRRRANDADGMNEPWPGDGSDEDAEAPEAAPASK
jgi:hypothetical protein